jgi:hypothetical protein
MTIDEKIHELTGFGQMFKSYADLLTNDGLHIQRKKEIEIMRKCGKVCMEVRQLVIETTIKED